MFDKAFLRSVALKAVYVVVASAVLGLTGWLDANPDVALWSLDSLKIALATAVVAGVKKFAGNIFVA
jgi:hypothetical protein